jgi:hypothetical protein
VADQVQPGAEENPERARSAERLLGTSWREAVFGLWAEGRTCGWRVCVAQEGGPVNSSDPLVAPMEKVYINSYGQLSVEGWVHDF